jgi:acyl-CoA synthetase (AMP-forming)/AMP-acid ligase II
VREAAVIGIRDARLGAVPVAAVERRPGQEIDEASLLARASDLLAAYELPVAVSVVDELPRTTSGKVDLAAIRALFDGVAATRGV